MTKSSAGTILALMILSVPASPAAGQGSAEAVVIGERAQLRSRILGETRELLISTPQSYASGNRRYGVVYVLDGDVHFAHTVASTRFLAAGFNDVAPELIAVAVVNTDRNRDFTPRTDNPREIKDFPTQGGADKFLGFLREELMPWVDEHYRTNAYSALVGHSLSGLFALYALANEPHDFDATIAISPSLWWNDESVIGRLQARFDSTPELDAVLYMACGDEPLAANARHLADILEQKAPGGFRWSLDSMPRQSHMSIVIPAVYAGLETVFDGWNVTDAALSMFEGSAIEDVDARTDEVDALYRQSGQRFGIDRVTPEIMVDNFENFLINNQRLDDAAKLMMRNPEIYPLVPALVDRLVSAYIEQNGAAAGANFLERLIEARPNSAIVRERMIASGIARESQR